MAASSKPDPSAVSAGGGNPLRTFLRPALSPPALGRGRGRTAAAAAVACGLVLSIGGLSSPPAPITSAGAGPAAGTAVASPQLAPALRVAAGTDLSFTPQPAIASIGLGLDVPHTAERPPYLPSLATGALTGDLSKVLKYAYAGIGSRYVWGGTSRANGWDCSGFVQWAYRQAGIELPRTEQWSVMVRTDNPAPGDLVAQRPDGVNHWAHVGIYVGNGMMISALNPDEGTILHSVGPAGSSTFFTTAPQQTGAVTAAGPVVKNAPETNLSASAPVERPPKQPHRAGQTKSPVAEAPKVRKPEAPEAEIPPAAKPPAEKPPAEKPPAEKPDGAEEHRTEPAETEPEQPPTSPEGAGPESPDAGETGSETGPQSPADPEPAEPETGESEGETGEPEPEPGDPVGESDDPVGETGPESEEPNAEEPAGENETEDPADETEPDDAEQAEPEDADAPESVQSLIVAAAESALGGSYDSNALISAVLAAGGITFDGDPEQLATLGTVIGADALQAGDLLYYEAAGERAGLVAVYVGDGLVMHGSWNGSGTVTVDAALEQAPTVIRVGIPDRE